MHQLLHILWKIMVRLNSEKIVEIFMLSLNRKWLFRLKNRVRSKVDGLGSKWTVPKDYFDQWLSTLVQKTVHYRPGPSTLAQDRPLSRFWTRLEKSKFRNFTEFGLNMNSEPSSRPVFEMPSRHLLYWLGNILKVCTVYYTSECSIDSFERTDSPWERIEKWIEQIEKTPGDDNVVVETNHHWFNHTGISNSLKYHFNPNPNFPMNDFHFRWLNIQGFGWLHFLSWKW